MRVPKLICMPPSATSWTSEIWGDSGAQMACFPCCKSEEQPAMQPWPGSIFNLAGVALSKYLLRACMSLSCSHFFVQQLPWHRPAWLTSKYSDKRFHLLSTTKRQIWGAKKNKCSCTIFWGGGGYFLIYYFSDVRKRVIDSFYLYFRSYFCIIILMLYWSLIFFKDHKLFWWWGGEEQITTF